MIGTVLNQRFALERELGRGGMGSVYRAIDQVLQRPVAIKVLRDLAGEEVRRKIRLEAQILARLLHENIVRIYDLGIAEGADFLVMEEVEGASFLKRWRLLDLPTRLLLLAQVADALQYAHRQGIIHRDVKPANILLTAQDQAKLSDFGLSVPVDEVQESGMTRGTPNYMSPEQAKGKRLDHRSDLYSLGVILYECATGELPFQGPPTAVMTQHVGAQPDSPSQRNPQVGTSLETLILRMLAKNPDHRPHSCQEVAATLRAIVDAELRSAAASDQASKTQVLPVESTSGHSPAASTGTKSAIVPNRELGRSLVNLVEQEPITLSADERYVTGHYLAYLLGGSRRQGIFGRRPLDERNGDRARLLLAMTATLIAGPSTDSVARGVALLEGRVEVRPLLSPIVVLKYLQARNTEEKKLRFRQARLHLKQGSPYAQANMVDARGALNPGLMPQSLNDLRRIAPARVDLDDELVHRWNRVAEVWRQDSGFRQAVLRYATSTARTDPDSLHLWPEVVYPLIERARWQRRGRTRLEAAWDLISASTLR